MESDVGRQAVLIIRGTTSVDPLESHSPSRQHGPAHKTDLHRAPLCCRCEIHLYTMHLPLIALVSNVLGSFAGGWIIWRPTVDGRNSSKDPLQQSGCGKGCASFRMAEVGQLRGRVWPFGAHLTRIPCPEKRRGEGYNTNPRRIVSTWQNKEKQEAFPAAWESSPKIQRTAQKCEEARWFETSAMLRDCLAEK